MKALFLIFHGFDKANGISKKIHYQVKALKECGLDVRLCYYDISLSGERRWMVDNVVIAELGQGMFAKIRKPTGSKLHSKLRTSRKYTFCLHPFIS